MVTRQRSYVKALMTQNTRAVKRVYEYSHLGGADVTSKTKESKESGRKAGLMLIHQGS